MEIKTTQWGGCQFSVPDQPTVLEIITHDSARFNLGDAPQFLVLWEMAKTLIHDWECAAIPDLAVDLATETDPQVARIIEWAGVQVSTWRRGLDAVPKN